MDEGDIIKICLVGSVGGLIILYLSIGMIDPEITDIGDLGREDVNRLVKVCGRINNLKVSKDGHLFFEIMDETGSIRVVIWRDILKHMYMKNVNISRFRNGAKVEMTGSIELYRNEIELIPLRGLVKFMEDCEE